MFIPKFLPFLKKWNDEEKGAQIDLVLDRKDQIINLFEVNFYNTEFTLFEAYAKALRQQISKKSWEHFTITYSPPHNQTPNCKK